MKKVFSIVFISAMFLGFMVYGFMEKQQRRNKIQNLENELEILKDFREREDQIDRMTKTLSVHYPHLSWYETHYYSVVFYDFSKKYGVPWEIYASMIRIESNFNPTIRSSKGAKGLTQVLESTAKAECKKLDIEYIEGQTLWNDLLNLVIGLTYLSEGISELGIEDGVRRYIGGPGFDKGNKIVGQYRTTVSQEYTRLKYIYRSDLLDEDIILDEDDPVQDTIKD